jgi:hypothetical protein
MTIFWAYFAVAIVVLLVLDLLTAPKPGERAATRANLKQSRRAA